MTLSQSCWISDLRPPGSKESRGETAAGLLISSLWLGIWSGREQGFSKLGNARAFPQNWLGVTFGLENLSSSSPVAATGWVEVAADSRAAGSQRAQETQGHKQDVNPTWTKWQDFPWENCQ